MSRLTKLLLLLTVAVGLAVPAALADNPHFISGPTCSGSLAASGTLSCDGKVAGLGNVAGLAAVVKIVGTVTCSNNGGSNPPGQQTFTAGPITVSNGQITFSGAGGSASCQGRGITGSFTAANFFIFIGVGCDLIAHGPNKGQPNSNCTLVLGPVAATFV